MSKLIIEGNPITTSRFRMSLLEKLLFLYLIKKFDKNQPDKITFSVKDFRSISDEIILDRKLGMKDILDIMKTLMKRVYEVSESARKIIFVLFKEVSAQKDEISVFLDKKIGLYIEDIRNNIPNENLNLTLSINKIYSKRIYEVLSDVSDKYECFFQISILDLKAKLGINNSKSFNTWNSLKKDVLEEAKKDISKAGGNIQFEYGLKNDNIIAFKIYNLLYLPNE